VLVEAASFWRGNAYIGVDFDEQQCGKARENAACADEHFDVLHADATALPLRAATVDVLLSDLPYGRQHGELSVLAETLYPAAAREAARILRVGGRAVWLVEAAQAAPFLRRALASEPLLRTVAAFEAPGSNPRVPVSFFCIVRLPGPGPSSRGAELEGADGEAEAALARLFDLSFTQGDRDRTWHDEKPSMDLYRPRSTAASGS
jgi:SAM-dependent methyltransferase